MYARVSMVVRHKNNESASSQGGAAHLSLRHVEMSMATKGGGGVGAGNLKIFTNNQHGT